MRQQKLEEGLKRIRAQTQHAAPAINRVLELPKRNTAFDEFLDALVAIDAIATEALEEADRDRKNFKD